MSGDVQKASGDISVAPAVSAAPTARTSGASAGINAIPADCTVTKPNLATTSLTCTARPAGQHWRLVVLCAVIGGWGAIYTEGTIVTGNGTSTAVCTEVVGYRAPTSKWCPDQPAAEASTARRTGLLAGLGMASLKVQSQKGAAVDRIQPESTAASLLANQEF